MGKKKAHNESEEVMAAISELPSTLQVTVSRDLIAFDGDHKWLEGEWSDADQQGEIKFSALRFDDDSVLVGAVLQKLTRSGPVEIGTCLATYRSDEFDEARADLVNAVMPPLWVLEVWADQMRQSA